MRWLIEKIRPQFKGKARLTEILKKERFVSRPALKQVLSGEVGRSKAAWDRGIVAARLEYGYSLTEIAGHLGLHYTTISKVVSQYLG